MKPHSSAHLLQNVILLVVAQLQLKLFCRTQAVEDRVENVEVALTAHQPNQARFLQHEWLDASRLQLASSRVEMQVHKHSTTR